jgi:hypothetical protein
MRLGNASIATEARMALDEPASYWRRHCRMLAASGWRSAGTVAMDERALRGLPRG